MGTRVIPPIARSDHLATYLADVADPCGPDDERLTTPSAVIHRRLDRLVRGGGRTGRVRRGGSPWRWARTTRARLAAIVPGSTPARTGRRDVDRDGMEAR